MKVELIRKYNEKQTLGFLYVTTNAGLTLFTCATLELPWKDNKRNISCVPEGYYLVKKRKAEESPSRDYDHFILMDVKDRDYILIHTGNFNWHIQGCILVGERHLDINKDGLLDVHASTATLTRMNALLPDEFPLTIKSL